MTEARYLAEVQHLPRPSDAQVDAFVDYVTGAHSWYKHLPPHPPGAPFLFYLNPNAGREWVITETAGRFRDRTNDTPKNERFHYTWRATTEYLELFGHLDYFTPFGTSFLLPTKGGVLDTRAVPQIQASDGTWIELPDVIRTVGVAHLTATIHPWAWYSAFMNRLRSAAEASSTDLDDALSERMRQAAQGEWDRKLRFNRASSPDPADLKELMPAEASEQTKRMREAVGRVLQWVYDPW